MREKPRIEYHKQPTLLNENAVIGAGISSFLLNIPVAVGLSLFGTPLAGLLAFGSSAAIGGIIGGSYGKRKMQEDVAFGKEVKAPSFLNRRFFAGGMGGYMAGVLGVYMVGLIAASISFPVAMALFTLPFVTGAIGAASGSISRRNEMAAEYAQAIEIQQANARQQTQQPEMAPEVVRSPELARDRDFGKTVNDERAAPRGASVPGR